MDHNQNKKLKYFLEQCEIPHGNPEKVIAITKLKINAYEHWRKRKIIVASIIAAASVIMAALIISLPRMNTISNGIVLAAETGSPDDVAEITMMTSEGIFLIAHEAFLAWDNNGKLTQNGIPLVKPNESASMSDKFNILMVPAGKRVRVELPDGTIADINTRTKMIFPRKFTGNIRNIYVQGEAFLDVAHNKRKPFVVTTDRFNLKVLGTRFDILAYPNTDIDQVVLVEGSVEITDHSERKMIMLPADRAILASGNIVGMEKVNTSRYTCWKDGYLDLDGYTLGEIVEILNTYYGTRMTISQELQAKKMYGKMVLPDSVEEVLLFLDNNISIDWP